MSLRNSFEALSSAEKEFALLMLEQGLCLGVRGLTEEENESYADRLRKCGAFIEMSHRILEQMSHYHRRSDQQRPDSVLFDMLDTLSSRALMGEILRDAWNYADARVHSPL